MFKNKIIILLMILTGIAFLVSPVMAADSIPSEAREQITKCGNDPFAVFRELQATGTPITNPDVAIGKIICLGASLFNFLSELAIVVAVLYIAIAGIKYQTASGDPKKQQSAISALQAAIIGFAIALSTLAIINYSLNLFEFNALTGQFQSVKVGTPPKTNSQEPTNTPNQSGTEPGNKLPEGSVVPDATPAPSNAG